MKKKGCGEIREHDGPSSSGKKKPKWGYIKPDNPGQIIEEPGEDNALIFYLNKLATTQNGSKEDFELMVVEIESGKNKREIRIANF
jgi:hypothetical protein